MYCKVSGAINVIRGDPIHALRAGIGICQINSWPLVVWKLDTSSGFAQLIDVIKKDELSRIVIPETIIVVTPGILATIRDKIHIQFIISVKEIIPTFGISPIENNA